MTYCVALKTNLGMVFLSDTRTNAGVDNISKYRKMFTWEVPGDRVITMMTSGNLAITQAVISLLQERIDKPEDGRRQIGECHGQGQSQHHGTCHVKGPDGLLWRFGNFGRHRDGILFCNGWFRPISEPWRWQSYIMQNSGLIWDANTGFRCRNMPGSRKFWSRTALQVPVIFTCRAPRPRNGLRLPMPAAMSTRSLRPVLPLKLPE